MLSRTALRELESACLAFAGTVRLDLPRFLEALSHSAVRAGLLVCADPAIALNLLLRDDPAFANAKQDGNELQLQAARSRKDMQAAIGFLLSDELFRLRGKLGLAV